MNQVITSEKIPIKLWLDDIDEKALQQAKNLANLPFAHHHIAIMPDAHCGYGMPIGGVLAAIKAIIPNAVGVDIGCGICSIKSSLNLNNIDINDIKKTMTLIRKEIPVGFNHHKEKQKWKGFDNAPDIKIIQQELESAKYQIGSLGGGNHFLELQKDEKNFLWIMIHSGSRNFGLKIANEYHKKAQEFCEKWYSNIPDKELSFIPLFDDASFEYMTAMDYALEFACESRKKMIQSIQLCLLEIFPDISFYDLINIHHNYASIENHFGKNVVVHRKGSTSAKSGELGIIPGSQGTSSYIVRGLGNPDSFQSCSHGAGRKLGRKQATKELSLEDEIQKLDKQGIIHSIRHKDDLDEASGAYKNIDQVMENQKDLVEIVTKLQPVAVIKG